VAGLALFHVDIKLAAPAQLAPAFINYPREDRAAMLHDEAMIKDLEPIYLLTKYNYASPEIIKSPQAPAQSSLSHPQAAFAPYPAEMNLEKDFRPTTTVPEPAQPGDILSLGQGELFKAAGRAPLGGTPLPSRDAHLEVLRVTSGPGHDSVRAESVALDENWPATDELKQKVGNLLWRPVTFSLLFDSGGLAATPLQLKNSYGNGSGSIDVDKILRDRLDQEFRRHPLPPGTYEALLGP
jgi:hypothetical protein